jgi:NCS1 family nucleobase:cation symporter-1
MAVGIGVSIPLFSNQLKFHGFLVRHHAGLGDLTFEVGFVVAGLLYYLLYRSGLGPKKQAVASGA